MFYNTTKNILKDTTPTRRNSPNPLFNTHYNQLHRNSSYVSDPGAYHSKLKTLPSSSELKSTKIHKMFDIDQKENDALDMKRCASGYLEVANSSPERELKYENTLQKLKKQNKSLRWELSELTMKYNRMQELQRDHQKLSKQFQKLINGRQNSEDLLLKQIDFGKQLQKRIQIQCSQNETLKQQIKLLENVVSDLRKQNSILGFKLDEASRRSEDGIIDRVGVLEMHCLNLQQLIREDEMKWQIHKIVWKKEADMYEEVIRRLQQGLSQR